MKALLTLFLFLLICLSCSSKKTEETKALPLEMDTLVAENFPIGIAVDTIEQNDNDQTQDTQPCEKLQTFVAEIEKMDWVSDPSRLSKVASYKYLHEEEIEYFNDRPFYRVSFEESALNYACTEGHYQRYLKEIDLNLFNKTKSIWAYFYRDKKASDWIVDGVIEQWTFEDEKQADLALKQMNDSGFTIYFNTHPYFCRVGKHLIIFQTRAMAFSYEQKPLFELFND